MSLLNKLKPGVNLYGLMEATVLDRDDPDKEGRVGVFIPRVMGLIPNSKTPDSEKMVVHPTMADDDFNAVAGTLTIKGINYLWAKRANRNGEKFGEWVIPRVGASVFVFFLDGDPTQLYYLPFGPGDRNSPPNSASDPDDVVIHETFKGSKIGFVGGGLEEFYVELPDGSGIKIVPKDQSITAMTTKGAAKLELKGGDISIIASGNISVKGTDVKVEGEKVEVTSTTELVLSTLDSLNWQPNIVSNCPFGGFPHGGVAGGISLLKGK